MQEEMLTLEKFEEASEIVKKVTLETKLVYSDYFSAQTGNRVYLKPENLQFTGAYKLRGAYYKMSTLTDEERAKGLITASAGNHAQGVAYAAKCYGSKATIVMPTTTPLIKVNRTRGYGAEVVLHGDVYDEACAKAYELAEEHGYTFIHPFDDLRIQQFCQCGNTGCQSAATDRNQNIIYQRKLFEDLHGNGTLTGSYGQIIKRMDESISVLFCQLICLCAGLIIDIANKQSNLLHVNHSCKPHLF